MMLESHLLVTFWFHIWKTMSYTFWHFYIDTPDLGPDRSQPPQLQVHAMKNGCRPMAWRKNRGLPHSRQPCSFKGYETFSNLISGH